MKAPRFFLCLLLVYLSPPWHWNSNCRPRPPFVNAGMGLLKKKTGSPCEWNSQCSTKCCSSTSKKCATFSAKSACYPTKLYSETCKGKKDCEGTCICVKGKCGGPHCGETRCSYGRDESCPLGCKCRRPKNTVDGDWCRPLPESVALKRTMQQCRMNGAIADAQDCTTKPWQCKSRCCDAATKKCKAAPAKGAYAGSGCMGAPAKKAAAHVVQGVNMAMMDMDMDMDMDAAEAKAERLADEAFRMGFEAGFATKSRNEARKQ